MTTVLENPRTSPAPPGDPTPHRRRRSSERYGVLALLLGTAVAYLWSLSASGWANSFYAAAVQAGTESWKAFFFGSLDASNAITVDKPPASLWVMELSGRIFGFSSWSMLVPEALMGVATVALTYATVRRMAGHGPAMMAGVATALTPSAALMFRFNNPDALLLLLLVGAGYATLRAAEKARGRWLVLAGVLVGFAFLTKMLQAFLVLPAFALVYLIAAPTTLRRRLLHLAGAGLAVVASAGWWIVIVSLWPASSRPYIDGSTNNSVLELVLGYNGLGRLTGSEAGGLGNAGFGSSAGFLRIFQGVSGGMVSWLLPLALIVLVAGLVALGRRPRTDLLRAGLILAGGSMVTTGLVFSFMAGIYHDYYTVALAPWIALTAVLGGVAVWSARGRLWARIVLAAAVAASSVWAFVLLGQADAQPYSALRWLALLGLAPAAAMLVVDRLGSRALAGLLAGVALTLSIGPAAYTVDTIRTPHTGSIVTAGPVSMSMGGPGGGRGMGGGMPGGMPGQSQTGQTGGFPGTPPTGMPGMTGGMTDGTGGAMPGGAGGFGDAGTVDAELTSLLQTDASAYTWTAATVRSTTAAGYELATGEAVMAIGGFNGTADSPTLAQFKAYVAQGQIHYFLGSGDSGMGGGGQGGSSTGSTSASEIQTWVAANFASTTVGGVTVYDLTSPDGTSATANA